MGPFPAGFPQVFLVFAKGNCSAIWSETYQSKFPGGDEDSRRRWFRTGGFSPGKTRTEPNKTYQKQNLGGGFIYFLSSPLFGEDSHFEKHIFQMG